MNSAYWLPIRRETPKHLADNALPRMMHLQPSPQSSLVSTELPHVNENEAQLRCEHAPTRWRGEIGRLAAESAARVQKKKENWKLRRAEKSRRWQARKGEAMHV